MISKEQAKKLAVKFVEKDLEVEISIYEIRETDDEWIFLYESKTFLETNNPTDLLMIALPIKVDKKRGQCNYCRDKKYFQKNN